MWFVLKDADERQIQVDEISRQHGQVLRENGRLKQQTLDLSTQVLVLPLSTRHDLSTEVLLIASCDWYVSGVVFRCGCC